ncbi:MAG: hypothetical protein QW579_01795 [Desulfurococcaceae archaeon]
MQVPEELREKLKAATRTVAKTCLGVKAGKKFLVITDSDSEIIGRATAEVCWEVSAETILVVMNPRTRHGEEPPEPIAAMWIKADAFVAPIKYSLTYTQAGKKVIKQELEEQSC